jgi:hypothetical protein
MEAMGKIEDSQNAKKMSLQSVVVLANVLLNSSRQWQTVDITLIHFALNLGEAKAL